MLNKSSAAEAQPQGSCLQFAELSPKDIAEGKISVEVTSPFVAPPLDPPRSGDCEDETPVRHATRTPELDFDSFKACRYEEVSFGRFIALQFAILVQTQAIPRFPVPCSETRCFVPCV